MKNILLVLCPSFLIIWRNIHFVNFHIAVLNEDLRFALFKLVKLPNKKMGFFFFKLNFVLSVPVTI